MIMGFASKINAQTLDKNARSVEATQYTVTFTVLEGTTPLESAKVFVDGQTITTDATGVGTIDLADGAYPYAVQKGFYCDTLKGGSISVNGAVLTEPVAFICTNHELIVTIDDGTAPRKGANVQLGGVTYTTDGNGEISVFLGVGAYSLFVSATNCPMILPPPSATVTSDPITRATFSLNCTDTYIDKINSTKVKIYPNPSNGTFSIEVNEMCKLEILNVIGKTILTQDIYEGTNSININNAGIYFVKVNNGSKTISYKIVVE